MTLYPPAFGILTRPQSLYPEIINCYTFEHPNVIQLKGLGRRGDGSLQLIFPWMHNGQIGTYVRDRIESDQPNIEHFVRRLVSTLE